MNILVTGAAGFIGSHLCEKLLSNPKNHVIGIDNYLDSTQIHLKERNLSTYILHPRFHFIKEDLLTVDWNKLLPNIDIIYHLGAVPGVRTSWGRDFSSYVRNNIQVTQRLLEACVKHPINQLIYASTSSIYGETNGKVLETNIPRPLSPYGITKLAGEHLCQVYQKSYDIPVVILRYFTVYGPRQRPDMAFHRFIKYILQNKEIPIFGDGKQTRDFTFIDDCVEATASVYKTRNLSGEIINIGGKERASILEVISFLEELTGKKAALHFLKEAKGEPKHTWADISKAQELLGYNPQTTLKLGLKQEVADLSNLYKISI